MKRIIIFDLKRYRECFNGFVRYLTQNRYEKLRSLRNKYIGKRCFIVCTGPSLNYEDLELIRGEYSFGMNSIIKLFDNTKWRPTFYGIQDKYVYEKLKGEICRAELPYCFISDKISERFDEIPSNSIAFPLNQYGHEPVYGYKAYYKFSEDVCVNVYDGFSITYSLIQIANYMGFREIYLLGCDCSYDKDPEKQHFVSSGHIDNNAYLMGQLQNGAYKEAKKYCDCHDLKIYNATRGGYLEIFPRVILEEVMYAKKNI